ncbi:S8 family peptidase [Paenibacillus ferrarius]|uniref:S8 family peptidase n=1 Tax=Paenibacillus ferrarius TaxID=1469647 RepID=UPI003D2ADCF3
MLLQETLNEKLFWELAMQLLCEHNAVLSVNDEKILRDLNVTIIHKAKLSPIYIIEAEKIEIVKNTGIFKSIQESGSYRLANEVAMTPLLSNKLLIKKGCVGWGGIKVAVLDSGIRPNNVNLTYSKDFTPYGFILNNHGTIVAKIISYYSPGCQILSMKIAHEGNDITGGAIIQALDDAIEQNVDIINMSLGGTKDCRSENCKVCDYVNKVVDAGFTVVAASGNSGTKTGYSIDCPGAAEKVITVGSVINDLQLAAASGKGVPGFNKPNLVAPGQVSALIKQGKFNTLEIKEGTSFATPVVTGILASLFSVYEQRDKIITNMYNSCKNLGLNSYEQGFGFINLEELMEVCENDSTILRPDSQQE